MNFLLIYSFINNFHIIISREKKNLLKILLMPFAVHVQEIIALIEEFLERTVDEKFMESFPGQFHLISL